MESITLGQIASAVALLAGLITGASIIVQSLKRFLQNTLSEKFNAIDVRLDELRDAAEQNKMEQCKDFLVTFLNDVASGQRIDDSAVQRFWERYDYYVAHGGNSYIREKVKTLKERGLL